MEKRVKMVKTTHLIGIASLMLATASANAAILLSETFESPVYANSTSMVNGSYTNFFVGTGGGVPGTVKNRNSNNSDDVPGLYVPGNSNASNHVLQMEWNSATGEQGEFWFNIPTHTWAAGQTYTLTVNAAPQNWTATAQRYIRPQLRQQNKTVLWTVGENASTAVPTIASGNPFGRQPWTAALTFSWTFSSDDFIGGTAGNLIQVHLDSSGQRGLYVDNVVLELVPEPASLALLGLGGLMLGRRRSR